jgi:23S rRNA (cytosine1962-C5)-methyltransferase
MTEKDERQLEYFRNRVAKNEKALRRWARREGVTAYRLYDRDIPEIPLALDWYRGPDCQAAGGDAADAGSTGANAHDGALCLALYDRPYEKDEAEEEAWLAAMARAACGVLGVDEASCFTKTRKRMKGSEQYGRLGSAEAERIVKEGGLSFVVNLSDYLDTGLFLDHRPLRARVRAEASGKRVLNLFAYTGAFSVHAAAGGASLVTTVDLSNTYLDWAERNLALNGFSGPAYPLFRSDVRAFLAGAARRGEAWDLIVADPPTFSNSKATTEDFDVNRDWPELVRACLDVLAPGGRLYFSTNSRRLKWEAALVPGDAVEISEETIPPDFRDRKVHRAFSIAHRADHSAST